MTLLLSDMCAHLREILSALENKIRIPARSCNILYFYSSTKLDIKY